MRKTKIICTLGPATESAFILRRIIEAGADVFRFNMSHAEHDWVREVTGRIRTLERQLVRPVAILLDTQGPAIRSGILPKDLELRPGNILKFTVRGAKPKEKYSVDVNYDGLIDDIAVGIPCWSIAA
jgi:pyruvate kinase